MATESVTPSKYLRAAFFIVIRALVLVLLGLNVRRKDKLPQQGPAIIVANHNSHLDTLVLISLLPLSLLPSVRPIAAADYFLKNRFMAWFATRIIGIIPIARGKASKGYDPLQSSVEALENGNIIILFPEGTRGEPEQISQFKKGVAHLVERQPQVKVTPVFIHGLGKALPKGDAILVPFFCDVYVGEAIASVADKAGFMQQLNASFDALASEGYIAVWE